MVSELRARGGATLLVAPVEPARANLRWPEKKQEMTTVLQDKLTLVELEIIGRLSIGAAAQLSRNGSRRAPLPLYSRLPLFLQR